MINKNDFVKEIHRKIDDLLKTPAGVLKVIMLIKDINQSHLSIHSKIGNYMVSQVINGHRPVSADWAKRLSETYDIPIEMLQENKNGR